MIWMHMGDDDTQYWESIEFVRKYFVPRSLGLVVGYTAIHNGPTRFAIDFITQKPQVNMI